MKNKFGFLLLLLLAIFGQNTFAQDNPVIKTRDVVYMKDGRVLVGEILIFQETDGDITFKDNQGRKYSITRKEYDYFVENERINIQDSDTLIINPRKIDEFEFSVGLSVLNFGMNGTSDQEYGGQTFGSPWYMPFNIRLGAGKYFNRKHFAGVRLDYALGGLTEYVSPALRYKYQFDGYKRNIAWYFALETKYEFMIDEFQSVVTDTTSTGDLSYSVKYSEQSVSNFGIVFAQGASFILRNQKSITVELSIFRNYVLGNSIIDNATLIPINRWQSTGLGLAFTYNI